MKGRTHLQRQLYSGVSDSNVHLVVLLINLLIKHMHKYMYISFKDIPKSGGTTAKRLYECMGQTLANRLGADPRFGHDKDNEIVVFHPFSTESDVKFVNVEIYRRIRFSSIGKS